MKSFHIKALSFALILSPLVYMACNKKNLEIPPPTQAESNYFQSENDFRTAVVGMYSGLTDYYASANPTAGANPELRAWFLPGDDLTIANGGESLETFKNINPNNDQLKAVWKSSYVIIGRANKLLEKLPPSTVFTTAGLKNSMLGEAYFLRGVAHFQLWNLFGTAPIDTILPTSTTQFGLKSSTGTQLIDQVIADFTRAASLLPPSWPSDNRGRATANSANGFLGKALSFRASFYKSMPDYTAALSAFNKITGASLATSFNDNFVVDKENNSESLFEFQAGNNIINNQNPWLSNEQCDCGSSGAYYQMFYTDGAGSYMGGGLYEPTDKLRNIFTTGDPRIQYTLTTDKTKISKYVSGDRTLLNALPSTPPSITVFFGRPTFCC